MAKVEVMIEERIATWDLPVALEESVSYENEGVMVLLPVEDFLLEDPLPKGRDLHGNRLLPPDKVNAATGAFNPDAATKTDAGLYVLAFEISVKHWYDDIVVGLQAPTNLVTFDTALMDAVERIRNSALTKHCFQGSWDTAQDDADRTVYSHQFRFTNHIINTPAIDRLPQIQCPPIAPPNLQNSPYEFYRTLPRRLGATCMPSRTFISRFGCYGDLTRPRDSTPEDEHLFDH